MRAGSVCGARSYEGLVVLLWFCARGSAVGGGLSGHSVCHESISHRNSEPLPRIINILWLMLEQRGPTLGQPGQSFLRSVHSCTLRCSSATRHFRLFLRFPSFLSLLGIPILQTFTAGQSVTKQVTNKRGSTPGIRRPSPETTDGVQTAGHTGDSSHMNLHWAAAGREDIVPIT